VHRHRMGIASLIQERTVQGTFQAAKTDIDAKIKPKDRPSQGRWKDSHVNPSSKGIQTSWEVDPIRP